MDYAEPVFDEKAARLGDEKNRIAARAAQFVVPGETIFLDGGSTILALARLLRDYQGLTIVTNSLRAASELSGGGPSVVVVGGALRRISQTMVGSLTRLTLDALHFDKAFMGTLGFSLAGGMTTTDADEAFTKELVLARSSEVILLADHTKVGTDSFARSGGVDQVNTLITDTRADAATLNQLAEAGLQIIQA
jgi:DeoR/GlpR family transcriptional regulator of sugar metabolism